MADSSSASSSLTSFSKPTQDAAAELAASTVGLVSKEEFTRRREELERAKDDDADGEKELARRRRRRVSARAADHHAFEFDRILFLFFTLSTFSLRL